MKSLTRILLLCTALLTCFGTSRAQLEASHQESGVWTFGILGGVLDGWQSGSYSWGHLPFSKGSGVGRSIALTAEMRFPSGSNLVFGVEMQAGWKEEVAKGTTNVFQRVLVTTGQDTTYADVSFRNDGALWMSSAMIAPSLTVHLGSVIFLGAGAQVLVPIRTHVTRVKTLLDRSVTIPELGVVDVSIPGSDSYVISYPDRVRDDARVSMSAMFHLGGAIPLVSHLSLVPRLALTVPVTRVLAADDDVKVLTAEGLLGLTWSL